MATESDRQEQSMPSCPVDHGEFAPSIGLSLPPRVSLLGKLTDQVARFSIAHHGETQEVSVDYSLIGLQPGDPRIPAFNLLALAGRSPQSIQNIITCYRDTVTPHVTEFTGLTDIIRDSYVSREEAESALKPFEFLLMTTQKLLSFLFYERTDQNIDLLRTLADLLREYEYADAPDSPERRALAQPTTDAISSLSHIFDSQQIIFGALLALFHGEFIDDNDNTKVDIPNYDRFHNDDVSEAVFSVDFAIKPEGQYIFDRALQDFITLWRKISSYPSSRTFKKIGLLIFDIPENYLRIRFLREMQLALDNLQDLYQYLSFDEEDEDGEVIARVLPDRRARVTKPHTNALIQTESGIISAPSYLESGLHPGLVSFEGVTPTDGTLKNGRQTTFYSVTQCPWLFYSVKDR